jgi:hypothetical protein
VSVGGAEVRVQAVRKRRIARVRVTVPGFGGGSDEAGEGPAGEE